LSQAVAHIHNPSYSEGIDREDHGSSPAQAKKLVTPPSQQNNLGMVVYVCHPR
jgi:hypothetical protein